MENGISLYKDCLQSKLYSRKKECNNLFANLLANIVIAISASILLVLAILITHEALYSIFPQIYSPVYWFSTIALSLILILNILFKTYIMYKKYTAKMKEYGDLYMEMYIKEVMISEKDVRLEKL